MSLTSGKSRFRQYSAFSHNGSTGSGHASPEDSPTMIPILRLDNPQGLERVESPLGMVPRLAPPDVALGRGRDVMAVKDGLADVANAAMMPSLIRRGNLMIQSSREIRFA